MLWIHPHSHSSWDQSLTEAALESVSEATGLQLSLPSPAPFSSSWGSVQQWQPQHSQESTSCFPTVKRISASISSLTFMRTLWLGEILSPHLPAEKTEAEQMVLQAMLSVSRSLGQHSPFCSFKQNNNTNFNQHHWALVTGQVQGPVLYMEVFTFFLFNWSRVNLQYCVSFKYTAWQLQDNGYNFLCSTAWN